MGEIQESVEEQVGTLAETFKNEFGDGMAKVIGTHVMFRARTDVGAAFL